ncbi:MAG: response regulator [Planctomycetota bacterium]|jgi:DNA-binding response OmpR family regulator
MRRRVLIVENDDDQRRLLALLLRSAGHVPVPAWSAEDGLDILEDAPCDLAVFDIQLPGMDGLKALSMVGEKLPRLPVILVTASGDVREMEALSLGAKGFLRKPFAASEFLDAVGAALASGGAIPAVEA